MAAALCRGMRAEAYVVTHIEDPRGTRSEQLGDIFRKYTDSPVIVRENVKDALLWVLENRGKPQGILPGVSLSDRDDKGIDSGGKVRC